MTQHFVLLKLGDGSRTLAVSTTDCTFVADFLGVIKTTFSPYLDSYSIAQLTLFRPDGTTEIDPQTSVEDLTDIPWNPLVVTVEKYLTSTLPGSSKKQLVYK